jgi:hypothetical protein
MQFIHKMSQYEPEELGFLDKTSKNNKTPSRSRGRSTQNCHVEMKQVFVQGCHLSATGLLTVDGVVASTVVDSSMTRAKYLEFLELQVVHAWSPVIQHCNISSTIHVCAYLPRPSGLIGTVT